MAPYIKMMRENISKTLGIELSQINIKATTEEGLGFTGNGEGISSQAICSISSVLDYIYKEPASSCCSGCNKKVVVKRISKADYEYPLHVKAK